MSDSPSSTAELVSTFLQRTTEGDADAIAALFADDVDWYVGGDPRLPWTGRRRRRQEVADYFRTMWPHFAPGQSRTTLEKVLVSGDEAVVLATLSHVAASTGRSFTTPAAMHIATRDGRIVRLHLFEDTLAVSRAFER